MEPNHQTQKHMKIAELVEYKSPYQINRKPMPKIRDNELLIKICAAGFCHSDLQVMQGQFNSALPLVPSHEPAGIIHRVGAMCKASWKVGDRVGVLNYKHSCAGCPGCTVAKRVYGGLDPRFCEKRETAGFHHDGAFAEYMVADPETTLSIPPSVSFQQAAPLMCAGATVWEALQKATASLEPGDTVAIVGIGGLGHLGVQFAKALGFRTIAIDTRPEGRQLATEVSNPDLMADFVVDSTSAGATEEIFQFTNAEGIAAAVVCTDSLATNAWTLRLLRIGGILVPLGLPAESWQFDSDVLVFRELIIRGSYVAGIESAKRMMRVVQRSGIKSRVTVVPFESLPGIFDLYLEKSFSGRLVVQISDEA